MTFIVSAGRNNNPECRTEQQTIWDTEYVESETQECETIRVPKCSTQYRSQCKPVQRQECNTVYENECQTQYQQQCSTQYKYETQDLESIVKPWSQTKSPPQTRSERSIKFA